MAEHVIKHDVVSEDLISLTKASPTIQVDVPIYEADGKTRKVDQDGRMVLFVFTLHRPTAGEGLSFAKFQRGKAKGKKITTPSQQETAIEAIKTCLPSYRSNSNAEILNVIVHTGGYLGDNAVLVNACLRLLGQNFDDAEEDDETPRWASEADLPT